MLFAMAVAASLCVFNGTFPQVLLYPLMPFTVDYVPYTSGHVISQLQILFFSALAFCWLNLRGLYPPELHSTNIDSDYAYRRAGPAAWSAVARGLDSGRHALLTPLRRAYGAALRTVAREHSPHGRLGEPTTTGAAALWAAVLLGAYLLLYYV